jgi:hypothetical protein
MGTGVSPATGFLKESGFSLEKDGGIAVDEYLRVKGEQNIYAIGDIAHYTQFPDKFQRRVEHWNVAGNMVRLCHSLPLYLSTSLPLYLSTSLPLYLSTSVIQQADQ